MSESNGYHCSLNNAQKAYIQELKRISSKQYIDDIKEDKEIAMIRGLLKIYELWVHKKDEMFPCSTSNMATKQEKESQSQLLPNVDENGDEEKIQTSLSKYLPKVDDKREKGKAEDSSSTSPVKFADSNDENSRFNTAIEYLQDVGEIFQFKEHRDTLFPQPDIFVNTARIFLDHDMHKKIETVMLDDTRMNRDEKLRISRHFDEMKNGVVYIESNTLNLKKCYFM